MKTKLLLLVWALTYVTFSGVGQDKVKYRVTEDNPDDNPKLYVNLEWFGMEGNGLDDNDAGTGLYFGLSGNYYVLDKLSVESYWRFKYFNIEESASTPIHFELGGNFTLISFTRKEKTQVTTESKTYEKGNKRYMDRKYINVDGNVRRRLNARGGLIRHKDTYIQDYSNNPFVIYYPPTDFRLTGLYGGLCYERDSRTKTSAGSAVDNNYIRFYADIVQYVGLKSTAIDDFAEKKKLGWRVGMQYYNSEGSGFWGRIFVFAEYGKRPVDKSYLNIGAGVNLVRR